MPLSVSYISVKFMSAIKDRNYFPKTSGNQSHYLITYPLSKDHCHKTIFFPFLRGPYRRFWKVEFISLSPKRQWISVTFNSLSAVPSPLILFVKKFLQRLLLADSPAVRNNSLCLEILSKNSADISSSESVCDQRKVVKLSPLARSLANR